MIFLLIPYLLLELYLSLKVGESIGFLGSVIWIVVTMLIGIKLLQRSPRVMVGSLQNMALNGGFSPKGLGDTATFYMLGAILLIIPGVLSDFLGVVGTLYAFYLQFTAKMKPEKKNLYQHEGDDDVIDVEIIDEYTDRNDRP